MTKRAIWWIRRDFRFEDNPALVAAAQAGEVIPLFIRDPGVDALGAAAKWRLGQGLSHLAKAISAQGGTLLLRSGPALTVLRDVIAEQNASGLHYGRLYDPDSIARDTVVKSTLRQDGFEVQSHPGHLLFEPPAVSTKTGGHYRVFTPYWRAVKDLPMRTCLAPPKVRWRAVAQSETLATWGLGAAMHRGAVVLAHYAQVGAQAARDMLGQMIAGKLVHYEKGRDFPSQDVTSGLSEPLTYGEISPLIIWRALEPFWQHGTPGAEKFLKELVWREFAAHLYFHEPHLSTRCHRAEWDDFPWQNDPDHPDLIAWQRGMTGVPLVDAGMRELYVTGRMHNRIRMVAASYLTKHLLMDWRHGLAWFADTLTDWDPASNALGWQWVAGCGPDAAPYFRVFNPQGQAEKFDGSGAYVNRWIAEGRGAPNAGALRYFEAVPKRWRLDPSQAYPAPRASLAEGRQRALSAYESFKM